MRDIRLVRETGCEFKIKTGSGFANALRRSLLNDVKGWAPSEVTINKNMSSETDEQLAHRIGMIPFTPLHVHEGVARSLSLSVTGREATTSDLKGEAFRATHEIPIVLLSKTQTLDICVHFKQGRGRDHARFSQIGPVSYVKQANPDSTTTTTLSFDTINKACPLHYLLDALLELKAKIQEAVFFVETSYDTKKKRIEK